MHVVMLSDLETAGGAAIAASRLASGLMDAGVEVTRVVGKQDARANRWATREVLVEDRLTSRLALRLFSESARDEIRQFTVRQRLGKVLRTLRPDIINIHNIHGAKWSPEILRTCREVAPVAWTLHDMWSFTGRCAYNYDCAKFKTGCDATCPTPEEYPELTPARIRPAWERRRRLLNARREVCAITPSRWLGRAAQSGFWSGHRVEVIPYGLDLTAFAPLDREKSRRELGITAPGPILLASAIDLDDRRKGLDLLAAALAAFTDQRLTLLTMGEGALPVPGVDVVPLGLISDDRRKRCAYSAADLFVHPARADNLPNVLLEAIACGTPVAAFDVGGMPDVVRPGVTGWLAGEISAPALAATLTTALTALGRGQTLRESCRAVAEADYALPIQAGRYSALFADMIAG